MPIVEGPTAFLRNLLVMKTVCSVLCANTDAGSLKEKPGFAVFAT
jgi:hypothetical protein